MNQALVALGSNLAPREDQLRQGIARLEEIPRTTLVGCSSLYETAPLGEGYGGVFLNAVAMLATDLGPEELWRHLLRIEGGFGREKKNRRGDRRLDLDLLDHGGSVVESFELVLPHPRMLWRPFVLVPLFEVLPTWVDPKCGISVGTLIGRQKNLQQIRWSARCPKFGAAS